MKSVVASLSWFSLWSVVGCQTCEDLYEKICTDLGPADCEVWKANSGPDTVTASSRSNSTCGKMMGSGVYEKILEGSKKHVENAKKLKK